MSPQFSKLFVIVGAVLIAAILVVTRKAWSSGLTHGGPAVWRIAKMTVAEARRKRVLQVVVLLVIAVVASVMVFNYLSPSEQARMMKDSGLTTVAISGILLAIFMAALFIPHEIESRTIYPILAKPVRRYEFVLGKYLGAMLILGVICVIVTVVLIGVLVIQDHIIVDQPDSRFDPNIAAVVFASVMSYFALAIFTAMVMLISSVASTTMTIISSMILWALGSMQSMLFEQYAKTTGGAKAILWILYHAVPPLQNFDFRSNVANGIPIDMSAAVHALGGGLLYLVIALVFAAVFFENRQV